LGCPIWIKQPGLNMLELPNLDEVRRFITCMTNVLEPPNQEKKRSGGTKS
jgi:hypothetical protein